MLQQCTIRKVCYLSESQNDVYGAVSNELRRINYRVYCNRFFEKFLGGDNVKELIKQAEELRKAIKAKEKEIDNPVLYLSILSELDNFIENVKED